MRINTLDEEYKLILRHLLGHGVTKQTRNGEVISAFGMVLRHNMQDGFPLLTTKKMAWKSIVTELLWFLRGDTNIKYLVDNGCHIWDGDAYKRYYNSYPNAEKSFQYEGSTIETRRMTKDEFIEQIKTDDEFAREWGELGPIYGQMWRDWDVDQGVKIDQIKNLIKDLKTNPDSRRLMVNAWNPTYIQHAVLPPCHYGFQVYTRELSDKEHEVLFNKNYEALNKDGLGQFEAMLETDNITPKRAISLMWNQRSVDTFLGLPFNIASYGLLLEIIAREVNMVPDDLIGNLGDVHLYTNHIEQAKEQCSREGFELPTLGMDYREGEYNKDLKDFTPDDFYLINYQSHPAIKAPLSN
jgi:thymidylate synthase